MWALLADATTTTITTTTKAAATTAIQIGTTLGSSTEGGGQGVWDSLFGSAELWAALLGALVGGFATAVGSYFLHRILSKKDLRIRMYGELIPALWNVYYPSQQAIYLDDKRGTLSVPSPTHELRRRAAELRRAGAILGGKEAETTRQLWQFLEDNIQVGITSERNLLWKFREEPDKLWAMNQEVNSLVGRLYKHLERKLTSRSARYSESTRARTAPSSGAPD